MFSSLKFTFCYQRGKKLKEAEILPNSCLSQEKRDGYMPTHTPTLALCCKTPERRDHHAYSTEPRSTGPEGWPPRSPLWALKATPSWTLCQ